jgi:hypothetical protein
MGGISFSTPPGPDAGTLSVSGPAGNAPITSVLSASGGSFWSLCDRPLVRRHPTFPQTDGSFTLQKNGRRGLSGPFMVSVSTPSLMNWKNMNAINSVTRSGGPQLYLDRRTADSFLLPQARPTTSALIGAFSWTLPADSGAVHGSLLPSLQAWPASPGVLIACEYRFPYQVHRDWTRRR